MLYIVSRNLGLLLTLQQLDAARHYYPADFVIEMCSYLSFFKQNVLHLHLSDNLYNNPSYTREQSLALYATFRLNSPAAAVAGLNTRPLESYDEATFLDIQTQCASRGVTIIPEIEAPGHALVIVQWKPQIGLSDLSQLNITHPDTLPTVKAIWSTFLPWMKSKTVHIGADEYSGPQSDYVSFVNDLSTYITAESGKSVRIWGTFPPKAGGTNTSSNVTIQHWEYFEDNPLTDYLDQGYEVLNSDDGFYVVGGYSGSYPQVLNITRQYSGNPATKSFFSPNIFDTNNPSNNPPRNRTGVLGQLAVMWNDYGNAATSVVEAYYSLRQGLPSLGDKQWGGDMTLAEYTSVFDTLHSVIPGQNLDRAIPSINSTIFNYTLAGALGVANDVSGNGYDGKLVGDAQKTSNGSFAFFGSGSISTPLSSKGRNYTLSFSVYVTAVGGYLFKGRDSALINLADGLGLVENNQTFHCGYVVPLNQWASLSLVASGIKTYLKVNANGTSQLKEYTSTFSASGYQDETVSLGINAPIATIGSGLQGQMKDIYLLDYSVL